MSVCKNRFICVEIFITSVVCLQESVYLCRNIEHKFCLSARISLSLSVFQYWSHVLSGYKNQYTFYLCGNIDHKFCLFTRISLGLSVGEYWSRVLSVHKNQSTFICVGILITSFARLQESVWFFFYVRLLITGFCLYVRIDLNLFVREYQSQIVSFATTDLKLFVYEYRL